MGGFGAVVTERNPRLTDLQNDMLQWLIDETLEHKDSLINVPTRLHLMNFAAMHTTSLVRMPDCHDLVNGLLISNHIDLDARLLPSSSEP